MIHRIDPKMSRFGVSVDLRFGASNLQVQISSKQRSFGTSGTRFRVLSPLYCWWFRIPSLVEVGSLCRYLQGFYTSQVNGLGISVCQDFLVSGNCFGIQPGTTYIRCPNSWFCRFSCYGSRSFVRIDSWRLWCRWKNIIKQTDVIWLCFLFLEQYKL